MLNEIVSTLRYPLKTGSLFFILACVGASAIVVFMFRILGVVGFVGGIVFGVFLLLWYARYLFFILEYTALGHDAPPIFEWEMVSPADRPRTLFQGVLLMTLIGLGDLVFEYLGYTAFTVYAVIAVLYFPATICVISVDQHIGRVFDPVRAFRLIALLGYHYLTILIVIVVAISVVALSFRQSGSLLLTSIVMFYAGVWLFHVIGRVLYAQRDAIGLDAERAPERDQEKADATHLEAQNHLIDQIFPLSRAGKYTNAMQSIDEYLRENSERSAEQQLLDALMIWENPYLGLVLAQRRLSRLLDEKDKGSALQLCERCLAADNWFRPNGADTTIRMAEVALSDGRAGMAHDLLCDFIQRFPGHPSQLTALNILIPVAARRDLDEAFVRELVKHYLDTVPADRRSPAVVAIAPLFLTKT